MSKKFQLSIKKAASPRELYKNYRLKIFKKNF